MTTAHPSVFSFFPEIFLFGVLPKRKIGKKRLTLVPPQVLELSPPTPVYFPKTPASDRGILRRLRLLRMTALSNQRADEGIGPYAVGEFRSPFVN